jgi:hypothetical protein
VIFGHSAKDVFPALYQDIERAILDRARVLHDSLESRTDPASRKKLRLLAEFIKRAQPATPAV